MSEFICYNPARLPSPAQWVTIERIRVIDSFTHIWWMSKLITLKQIIIEMCETI